MGYKLKCIGVYTLFSFFLISGNSLFAQDSGYQKPPQAMVDLVEASTLRKVSVSGGGNFLLTLETAGYPNISEITKPYLKLAGLRINPQNHSNGEATYYTTINLKNLKSGEQFTFDGIPKASKIKDVSFSPAEDALAFSITTADEVTLWVADIATKSAKRLGDIVLNDTYGTLYQWTADGTAILAKALINQKYLPDLTGDSGGPTIMQSNGVASPNRTYPDLLKNTNDETLLDYYLTSQLKMVYLNGPAVNYNRPEIYKSFDFSPDGDLVMLSTIQKPYSYAVPISHFAHKVELRDKYGKLTRALATVPLADQLPQGFDAVVKGPREYAWRADKAQTVFWVEAQDEGNPNIRSTVRDILYTSEADKQSVKKLADCYLRFKSIDWGDDQLALVHERWFKTRGERRVFIKPGNSNYRVNLWDRYYEDAYSDPGDFVKTKNQYNRAVLLLEYNVIRRAADPNNVNIFSISDGASPQGERPFLLQFNVKTKVTDTLFRSRAPFYERPIFYDNKDNLVISRESVIEPTNYFNLDFKRGKTQQLTYFKNPYPALFGVIKQSLKYQRKDKLPLSAMLYLPQTYRPDQGRLPVLMWASPQEYKTENAAGQVKGSPYRFNTLSWDSPLYWVTQGYAVMDQVDMPIVGESNDQPNDTFLEQLRENAEAAVEKIVSMGVGDPKRIAIGGQSYGAAVTANLLAQTDLFAAGIGINGTYNRTLTPFGFQAEERNYWEAPEVYFKLSPFSYAHKIKAPLLLAHGLEDSHSGTLPVQSERFYSALKGFGVNARLVLLPSEGHSYQAKESVLHLLWEMNAWLDTYVKNKK